MAYIEGTVQGEMEVELDEILEYDYKHDLQGAFDAVCKFYGLSPIEVYPNTSIEALSERFEEVLKEILYLKPHARKYVYESIDKKLSKEALEFFRNGE